MRASQIEFRFRLAVIVVIVSLGFWAPWIESWGVGSRISLLEWSALQLSRLGLLSFTSATPFVIVVAAVIAALGAFLRVWGTAWLGAFIVDSLEMRAGDVMAGGPFRYVRHPNYAAVFLEMLVLPLIHTAWITAIAGAAAHVLVLSQRLSTEERVLFSDSHYRAAMSGKPRFVPGLF